MKKIIIIAVFVFIMVVALFIGGVLERGNPQEYIIVDVTVQTELETVNDNAGQSVKTKYLYLCTTDKGETIAFENEDSLLNGKFNSSDILGEIKRYEKSGKPFKIFTRGYRIGLLSMYQNIIKTEEVEG